LLIYNKTAVLTSHWPATDQHYLIRHI